MYSIDYILCFTISYNNILYYIYIPMGYPTRPGCFLDLHSEACNFRIQRVLFRRLVAGEQAMNVRALL